MAEMINNFVFVATIYNLPQATTFYLTGYMDEESSVSTPNTILIANMSVVIGSKTYFGYAVTHQSQTNDIIQLFVVESGSLTSLGPFTENPNKLFDFSLNMNSGTYLIMMIGYIRQHGKSPQTADYIKKLFEYFAFEALIDSLSSIQDAMNSFTVSQIQTMLSFIDLPYNFNGGVSGGQTQKSDGTNNTWVSRTGNGANCFTNFKNPTNCLPYSQQLISNTNDLGYLKQYFTLKYSGIFIGVYDFESVNSNNDWFKLSSNIEPTYFSTCSHQSGQILISNITFQYNWMIHNHTTCSAGSATLNNVVIYIQNTLNGSNNNLLGSQYFTSSCDLSNPTQQINLPRQRVYHLMYMQECIPNQSVSTGNLSSLPEILIQSFLAAAESLITCCSNCQSCSGGSICIICLANYYLMSNQCYICPQYCKTCSNATTCTSCYSLQQRFLNKDNCSCNTGYFDNGKDNNCQVCPTYCQNCSNATTCTSCYPLQQRSLNGSNCSCISGYFDDRISTNCIQCSSNCSTCSYVNNNCTSCISGYSGSVCINMNLTNGTINNTNQTQILNSTINNQSSSSANQSNQSIQSIQSGISFVSQAELNNSNYQTTSVTQNDPPIHVSQNLIQSTMIQSQGIGTLKLRITISGEKTQQQIQSYLNQMKTCFIPADVQSRSIINSSILSNQITYNIIISGPIQYTIITVNDSFSQLIQQTLIMVKGKPINSSITKQQSAISNFLQQNKTITSKIFNQIRCTAIFTLLADNSQVIAHYLLIDLQVPEQVWEGQRIIALFTWKTIPPFADRFNHGTIQKFELFGIDVSNEVEKNQPDLLPFHILMISNYFLVNLQTQLLVIILVIFATIYSKTSDAKNQLKKKHASLYLTHELKNKSSLQLLCQVLEAITLLIFASVFFQFTNCPFHKGGTALSILSYIIGFLIFFFYLFIFGHQFIIAWEVRSHISSLIKYHKQLSPQHIEYYSDKYPFNHNSLKINAFYLTFFYRYILILKRVLFAFTSIILFGYPLTQLIILEILQISSILLTLYVRPYILIYEEVFYQISNILLSIALGFRVCLQKVVYDLQIGNSKQGDDLFDKWDNYGWVIVYCELLAVMIEAILTIIKIVRYGYQELKKKYRKYLNRKINKADESSKESVKIIDIQSGQNDYKIDDNIIASYCYTAENDNRQYEFRYYIENCQGEFQYEQFSTPKFRNIDL